MNSLFLEGFAKILLLLNNVRKINLNNFLR